MDYRLATIQPRKQYTADTTEIIDIDISDPISQIVVTAEPDNNPSGANATAHPARCISKIELVDGSDVLFSLSGQETQGLDFYHNRMIPPNFLIYLNGMYSEMIMNMNFGRYLWDEELAFDPGRFTNPQLKIALDIDGGGDESDDVYLTVLAHAFDERSISPRGFLMAKEIKAWTLANSTHEYTDLPTDYLYKQLLLRTQRYGIGPEYQVDTVKLSEENDKRRPIDHTMFQILRHLAAQWPRYEEMILVPGMTSAQYFYNTPCYFPTFTDTQWRAAVATAEASIYGGGGGRFQHDAEASGPNHQIHCMGWAPHAMVPLLPMFGEDTGRWYDVTKLGSLKLDVLSTSSVGTSQTAEVVLQQLRNYA